MSKRDRAWRRSQRARTIQNRESRLPEPAVVWPIQVWQLHTPDGQPMPLFHRQTLSPNLSVYRTWPESIRQEWVENQPLPDPVPVVLWHDRSCHKHEPYFHYHWNGFNYEREQVVPSGPCECSRVSPYWRGGQVGFVWKMVRRYLPDRRPRAPGKVAKTPPQASGCKPVKNWKLLYTRSVKVKRARQLGFIYGGSFDDDEPYRE